MMGYMFGVLGSVAFWCVYAIVSIIMMVILMRENAPRVYAFLITGRKSDWD